MNESDIIDYWNEVALYDLETARAMLEAKRFLYVGFMCHQAIEKILKAMYVKRRHADPPRTHNLLLLSRACGAYQELSEEQLQLMDLLEPLNIEARYPTDKAKLLKNLTRHRCEALLKETTELYQWIKQKLSNG